ncbi:class I SAM-dependent methyltransferase [Aeromicrobium sp. Leaf350]|uniref:class I SAM-dependent methyltransferase n=1 Tax=Aeromicrobium sp. Leaf350 TaxID=2876565 RepID=UPI001E5594CC|nr:class I SAM-dependent methyltransferase [Aeromicrobium sp. Leaf350]
MSDVVSEAYAARAAEYVEVVGMIEHAAETDRAALLAWARSVDGPIIDVGCGPGQWTSFLHQAGADVEGVEPVAAFLVHARARYPSSRCRAGRAEDLGVEDASLGGVLAWFSLIHTHPDLLHQPLAELARCIRPGGTLAIGFFDGPAQEPFDHAVTTAYYWSVDALSERLERAGFSVLDARTRTDPGARAQGLLVAQRQPSAGATCVRSDSST